MQPPLQVRDDLSVEIVLELGRYFVHAQACDMHRLLRRLQIQKRRVERTVTLPCCFPPKREDRRSLAPNGRSIRSARHPPQAGARDEFGFVTGKEQGRIGDVLGVDNRPSGIDAVKVARSLVCLRP